MSLAAFARLLGLPRHQAEDALYSERAALAVSRRGFLAAAGALAAGSAFSFAPHEALFRMPGRLMDGSLFMRIQPRAALRPDTWLYVYSQLANAPVDGQCVVMPQSGAGRWLLLVGGDRLPAPVGGTAAIDPDDIIAGGGVLNRIAQARVTALASPR